VIPAARPFIGEEERVLRSGRLVQGEQVAAFELEFAAQVAPGAECVAVNSGTSALHLALLAYGIGPGDEVVVPSFTFAATANAVAMTGATPVFADVDPLTYCLDPDAALSAATPRTAAIMPVHLYGHPAALAELSELAARLGVLLLEDSAQAHAASLDGRNVGTWGHAGAFSFYPTKNMMSGEGGMVTCQDAEVARTVRLLRNQGQEQRYANEIPGLNNRMTDIHAAIGRVQLRRLGQWTDQRIENASFYDSALVGVATPAVAKGARHVYHQYTIRVSAEDRDQVVRDLSARGVGTGVYYPTPVHRLQAYSLSLDLPVTERLSREVLSLPVYPTLTERERDQVVAAVNDVLRAGG
jgi:dTDP-4-amino-4,6-dideoxygalactose transaminase